ncbi:putative integrase catalytic domain-containing protein [Phytophthora infestans]|uniref:Putative integrase catalytic domain-containing protein n=1 Tax=Phytophthora infestans TaxID=4787 RepID=A0A833SPB6_PHYIN|nr:putative integrase catalytic domain-containing protein [Phytophthora infestans]
MKKSTRIDAEKVLQRFETDKCYGCKVPSTENLKLSRSMCPMEKEEKELMQNKPYRSVISTLIYLILGTLAYLVRDCTQYLQNT